MKTKIPHLSHRAFVAILFGILAIPTLTYGVLKPGTGKVNIQASLRPWVTVDRSEFRAYQRAFRNSVRNCKLDGRTDCASVNDPAAFELFVSKSAESEDVQVTLASQKDSVNAMRSLYRSQRRKYTKAVSQCAYEVSTGKRAGTCPSIRDFQTEEDFQEERRTRGRMHAAAPKTRENRDRERLQYFTQVLKSCPDHLKGKPLYKMCRQALGLEADTDGVVMGFLNLKQQKQKKPSHHHATLESRLRQLKKARKHAFSGFVAPRNSRSTDRK